MDIPHFIHLCIDGQHFRFLAIKNNAAMNIRVQFFGVDMFLFLLGIYLAVELLGCMFNILRNCRTVFPK